MACLPILERQSTTPVSYKRVGFMCGFEPEYEFGGYLFEVHHYFGPVLLRRNTHDARVTIPNGFWKIWKRLEKLSEDERKQYAVDS